VHFASHRRSRRRTTHEHDGTPLHPGVVDDCSPREGRRSERNLGEALRPRVCDTSPYVETKMERPMLSLYSLEPDKGEGYLIWACAQNLLHRHGHVGASESLLRVGGGLVS
jgi:hypothetical protein